MLMARIFNRLIILTLLKLMLYNGMYRVYLRMAAQPILTVEDM